MTMKTSRTTSPVASILLVGALLASLVGCSGGTASSAESTPSATATPVTSSATPSAEPATPSEAGPPALSTLVVTPSGIGALVMGQPIPVDATSSALVVWDPTRCVREDRPAGDPWAGAWVSTYPEIDLDWARNPTKPFTVFTEERTQDGPLGGITVWSPELATAAGVHPGSTRDELEAAYGTFASVTEGALTDVYVVQNADTSTGELWFEVANDEYATNSAGTVPASIVGQVLWISVQRSGFAPYSLTETDSLGGDCVA